MYTHSYGASDINNMSYHICGQLLHNPHVYSSLRDTAKSNIDTNFNGNANNSSNENGGGLLGAISNIGSHISEFTDLIGGYTNPNDGKHYTNEKEFNQFMYCTQISDLRSIDDPSYNLLRAQGGAPISTQTSASHVELELFSNLMFGYHSSAAENGISLNLGTDIGTANDAGRPSSLNRARSGLYSTVS